jgi:hypothetical protein
VQPSKESFIRQPRFLILTALVLLAALCRLIDHGFVNVAPVGAIALFGGACFRSRKAAFMVPLSAVLVSDILLNVTRHSGQAGEAWQAALFVYPAFALVACLGLLMRKHSRSIPAIVTGSLAGSLIFFFVSNLAAWGLWYQPLSFASLIECYWNGIVFLRGQSGLLNTIAGDVFFNAVLFGSFALVESRVLAPRPQVEAA